MTTHHLSYTKVHRAWTQMKNRCFNKNALKYPRYGGRGISVCERWMKFENFFKDMGHPPSLDSSLDRIDNNSNYEPGNCRWATMTEQQNNKGNNHHLEFKGQRKTIAAWARMVGIKRSTLKQRILYYGWPIEKALTKEVQGGHIA